MVLNSDHVFSKQKQLAHCIVPLRQPWGARIPIPKLVRLMMLVRLFQVFCDSS